MRREARVHPRKHAVVSLAEGCVAEATSAPLKKTHDTSSTRTYAVYTRPRSPDHTRRTPRREEGERRVCTRVSTPS